MLPLLTLTAKEPSTALSTSEIGKATRRGMSAGRDQSTPTRRTTRSCVGPITGGSFTGVTVRETTPGTEKTCPSLARKVN